MTRVIGAGVLGKRGVALTAAVALAVTLALAGCGGRGAHGQNGSGNEGLNISASTTSQVQTTDQQVQNALSGLGETENGATSADSTSQEGTALP